MTTPKMLRAIAVLNRSEHGRTVARELTIFLKGQYSGLDANGRNAVLDLLEEYMVAFSPSSTVDLLRSIKA